MSMVKVVIADSHPVFRDGLASACRKHSGISVVAETGNGPEAIRLVRELRPDVLLVDLELTGLDGIAVLRSLSADSLPTRTLVLSAAFSRSVVYDAISAGVSGFLSKQLPAEAICSAIEEVHAGRNVWPAEMQEALATEIRGRHDGDGQALSPREIEILKFVADGETTAAIAAHLYLSQATIKTHLHRSFSKLGVNDRAAAVAEALRRGLFD